MTAIEKYVEAMENKDYAGLANLFSPDGIINDFVLTQQPRTNIIYMDVKLSTCSSVTSSASANTLS